MHIIKLNAIDSTNSFLKKLAIEKDLKRYTTVVAEYQSAGRGQLQTKWVSEEGKNLMFSVFVNFKDLAIEHQFYVSMAVSLGVLNTLNSISNNSFSIKWPNDILAEKEKICGILIENVVSGTQLKQSVIGIGINVNQETFPQEIKMVTSLKSVTGSLVDKDLLLKSCIESIKNFMVYVDQKNFRKLKKMYLKALFKFQIPSMFETDNNEVFLAKIIDVLQNGELLLEFENETTRKFNLKEIKFVGR